MVLAIERTPFWISSMSSSSSSIKFESKSKRIDCYKSTNLGAISPITYELFSAKRHDIVERYFMKRCEVLCQSFNTQTRISSITLTVTVRLVFSTRVVDEMSEFVKIHGSSVLNPGSPSPWSWIAVSAAAAKVPHELSLGAFPPPRPLLRNKVGTRRLKETKIKN